MKIMACYELPLPTRVVRGNYFTHVSSLTESELIRVRDIVRREIIKKMELDEHDTSQAAFLSVVILDQEDSITQTPGAIP
jgi:hypothetical protein